MRQLFRADYVAPLKSLLQDQYERLVHDGMDCVCFISSALKGRDKLQALARFKDGHVRMLLVSPERFLMAGFRELLETYQGAYGSIRQVVVDECHCVSEWGHDFRPSYLSLSRVVRERTKRLGSIAPVVALTGTASTVVLEDVRRELGMKDRSVEVRASRLDRPELTLHFCPVNTTDDKIDALTTIAEEFVQKEHSEEAGLLVFTGHTNGRYGVLGLADRIAARLGLAMHEDIRVYSGERPKKFNLDGVAWDSYKASTQQDFISGKQSSFRIMVATKSFGMGIDKPSIREVVHVLAPQSPEAYYQEVGRAARDRQPAGAHLLFSDQDASTTDLVLSPDTTIEEARTAHQNARRSAGDFLITFYFHAERFQGIDAEVKVAIAALAAIKSTLESENVGQVLIRYSAVTDKKNWSEEPVLEQSLVRLIHMGVVADYTKDYLARSFLLTLCPQWLTTQGDREAYKEYLVSSLENYLRRYTTRVPRGLLDDLHSADDKEAAEKATLTAMIRYLYEEVERKRRAATRKMLEIARVGVERPEDARKQLLLYLQTSAKYSDELVRIAKAEQLDTSWETLLKDSTAPSELEELRGATSRILESYPTHPGLLFLSAIVRVQPTVIDLQRSREEFMAALRYATDHGSHSHAAELAEVALAACGRIDGKLADELSITYGEWGYTHFGARFALARVASLQTGRLQIMRQILKSAALRLPIVDL